MQQDPKIIDSLELLDSQEDIIRIIAFAKNANEKKAIYKILFIF